MSKKKSKKRYPNGGPLNTSGPRNTNTADTYVPLDGTRPYYVNEQGQKVSEGKITVGFDDGVYVIPTVWDGVQHTDDEAVKRYKKTGRHMGKFKTQEEADRASQLRTSIYNNNPAYFAGGGKLGDALKLTGDTLLSTVGLTDVIGDDAYRNQGFADASRVGEQIGLGAGKVAGNLLLPGMGGALVSQGQNLLGNIDGEDLERQRIAEMRANPGKFGKYASSISQMNSAIDPLAMGAAFAGEAGSAVAGNIMQAPAGANLQQKLLGNMYDPLAASFGKGLLGRNRNNVNPLQKPSINTIPNNMNVGMPEYGSLNAFGGKMYAQGGKPKKQHWDFITNPESGAAKVHNLPDFNYTDTSDPENPFIDYRVQKPYLFRSPVITKYDDDSEEYTFLEKGTDEYKDVFNRSKEGLKENRLQTRTKNILEDGYGNKKYIPSQRVLDRIAFQKAHWGEDKMGDTDVIENMIREEIYGDIGGIDSPKEARKATKYNQSTFDIAKSLLYSNNESEKFSQGGMIKRADGSYSKRGLWDNIRANKGSNKKPTKDMLAQEAKIKKKMMYGGEMKYPDGGPIKKAPIYVNNPDDPRYKAYQDSLSLYNQSQITQNQTLDQFDNWLNTPQYYTDYYSQEPTDDIIEKDKIKTYRGAATQKDLEDFYYPQYDNLLQDGLNKGIAPVGYNIAKYKIPSKNVPWIGDATWEYDNQWQTAGPHNMEGGSNYKSIVPRYKNPVQPYIVDNSETSNNPINKTASINTVNTTDNISMPEQVIKGSDRYNELKELEDRRQRFLDSQSTFRDIQSRYTSDPIILDRDTAKAQYDRDTAAVLNPYIDTDRIGFSTELTSLGDVPEGASVYKYRSADLDPRFQEMSEGDTKLAMRRGNILGSAGGYDYYYGYEDPGVPEYEVIDPYADIDLEDISEEKTYNPIQASYKRGGSGNTTRGNIGYTYGYQSDPSSLEFQTQSPYGNKDIYQLRAGDKVSVFDKNIDPLVQEHMNYLNARKAAENMEPIVSFAHGGNIDLMSNGEKFVEYQGPSHEGGGINIDNQGMPTNAPTQNEVEGGETLDDNGIDQYIFSDRIVSNPGEKNKKTYADLSKKINNKYKNTDEDPIQERTRRLELEQLKAEQEAAKAMMNGNESSDDMMGMQNSFAPGGFVNKYPNGGSFSPSRKTLDNISQMQKLNNEIEFNRKELDRGYGTHWYDVKNDKSSTWQERDIKYNQKEMESLYNSMTPEEKIEYQEVINRAGTNEGWNYLLNQARQKGYISNNETNPRAIGDWGPKTALYETQENPIGNIHALRGKAKRTATADEISKLSPKNKFFKGGKMKYPDGGTLKPIPIGYEEPFVLDNFGPFAPINTNDPTINQLYNMQQGMQQNVGPVNNSVNRFSLTTPPETMSLDEATKMSDPKKGKKSKKDKDTDTTANQLPQDVINPLGYLASNVGNIYDLAQAAQDTPANDFGGVNLDTINLEGQRDELRKQAGAASAVARRNARNAGSAGAAFTNQAISNALINANLASSLSQSYMTEEQQNTAIKNQEEQINQQVRIQEKLADQQDLALRKSTVSQALHNIGMNTQGFAKDLESARVGNINNEMWFNAIKEGKYVDMRYDAATGSTVIINKDGSVWNKAADGSITEVKPDKKLSKKEQETISNLFIQ